jgi:S1-C subfamily serine protease
MTFSAPCFPAVLAAALLSACAVTPSNLQPDPTPPGREVKREAAARLTAIVISSRNDLDPWLKNRFTEGKAPEDADGGSGIPITHDGYFLTADHVLARSAGKNVFVLHGQQGGLRATKARIVWRSASTDLALLHIPLATPRHYSWTSPDQWLPAGTPVIHAGISTGHRSGPGKLVTAIPPGKAARFKHDIPLEPGDSGGAVIDARGRLVGVNSAVEFLIPLDTAFFIESEANRPNVRALQRVIEADRRRNKSTLPAVSAAS